MGKIIGFATCLNWRKTQMTDTRYEQLLSRLTKHPASDYSISKAELLADEVLEAGGYSDIQGAVPVLRIVKGFGITPFSVTNLSAEFSGNIYVGGTTEDVYGTDKAIVVNDSEEPYHKRFIVAHEFAHYMLDYVGNKCYQDGMELFTKAYLKSGHDTEENERRADRFAAELLMPAKTFLKYYANAILESNNLEEYILTFLSELFEVKQSSVRRRIEELGL